jgi:hypothetical protein
MDRKYLERIAAFAKKGDEVDSLYESEGEEKKLKSDYFDTVMKWLGSEKARLVEAGQSKEKFGKKQGAQIWESWIKSQLGIDAKEIGDDLKPLVSAKIADLGKAKAPAKPTEFTEETFKAHPLFQKVFDTTAKTLREERDSLKGQVEKLNNERAFTEAFSKLKEFTFDALKKGSWKAGTKPEEQLQREKTIIELLTNRVQSGVVKLENGKPAVYDSKGNKLQTNDFVDVSYEEYVVNQLNPFGVISVDPSNSSPQPNGQSGSGGTVIDVKTMTKQEFGNYLSGLKTEDKQKAIDARLKATAPKA